MSGETKRQLSYYTKSSIKGGQISYISPKVLYRGMLSYNPKSHLKGDSSVITPKVQGDSSTVALKIVDSSGITPKAHKRRKLSYSTKVL